MVILPDLERVTLSFPSRHNDKRLIPDSVNAEIFFIKCYDVFYSCIHAQAYNCSISVIHWQI